MSLSLSRYGLMLFMQIGFIVIDILINSFSDCFRHHSVILLIIYLFQDVCIIFALITLVLCYFSTYQFQAGMIESLFERDRMTVLVTLIYLFLTIGWQYWSLNVDWDTPTEFNWTTGMLVLYDIQRTLCVFYYYLYKRSALMLSDPSLYVSVSPSTTRRAEMVIVSPRDRISASSPASVAGGSETRF